MQGCQFGNYYNWLKIVVALNSVEEVEIVECRQLLNPSWQNLLVS